MNEKELILFKNLIETDRTLYWNVCKQLKEPGPIYSNYYYDRAYENLIDNIVRFIDSCDCIKNFLKDAYVYVDKDFVKECLEDYEQKRT